MHTCNITLTVETHFHLSSCHLSPCHMSPVICHPVTCHPVTCHLLPCHMNNMIHVSKFQPMSKSLSFDVGVSKVVPLPFRVPLGVERLLFLSLCQSTPTLTSSSTWAVGRGGTRCPKCCGTFLRCVCVCVCVCEMCSCV